MAIAIPAARPGLARPGLSAPGSPGASGSSPPAAVSYRLTGSPLVVAGKSAVLGLQPLGDATGDSVAASASGGASVSPGSATMSGIVPLFLLFSAATPGTYQVSVSSAGGGEVIGSPLSIVVEAAVARRRPAWVPVRADYGRRG